MGVGKKGGRGREMVMGNGREPAMGNRQWAIGNGQWRSERIPRWRGWRVAPGVDPDTEQKFLSFQIF
jgi:hypothetical protein